MVEVIDFSPFFPVECTTERLLLPVTLLVETGIIDPIHSGAQPNGLLRKAYAVSVFRFSL